MGVFADLLRRLRWAAVPGARGSGWGIVDYLNIRRPQRARRLFTALFDPVLAADDPVLLRWSPPLPGLVRRVDLAGLWAALECFAFTRLTAGVQSALDEQAVGALLDDVLKSPEALDGQRRMRIAAHRFLGGALLDGGELAAFLDLLNRERLIEARRQVPGLTGLAPLERPFLEFVHGYLPLAERCARPLAVCAAEATAERLAQAADEMRRGLGEAAGPEALAHLVPLTALHVGRQYGAVALMARDHGRPRPVIEALLGHFSACCAALGERAVSNAAIPDTITPDAIIPRLTLILPALIVAGVLDDPESGPLFQAEWRRLAGLFEDCLAAAPGRSDGPDLLRLIGGWHLLARTYDQEVAGFGERLEELGKMLEAR